jgi:putative transposase
VVWQLLAWVRLSRRVEAGRDIEVLVLRHRLAVARCRLLRRELQGRLTWCVRVCFVLLVGVMPEGGLSRLRLIVTPGTVLSWHRVLPAAPSVVAAKVP